MTEPVAQFVRSKRTAMSMRSAVTPERLALELWAAVRVNVEFQVSGWGLSWALMRRGKEEIRKLRQ